MNDLVKGIIGAVIVGVIGIGLLSLGSQGSLPNGFGLFNMDNLGTRAIVTIVLLILTAILAYVYFNGRETSSEE